VKMGGIRGKVQFGGIFTGEEGKGGFSEEAVNGSSFSGGWSEATDVISHEVPSGEVVWQQSG